jgi:hypothetical protein
MSLLLRLNAEEKVSEWKIVDQNILENALLTRIQAQYKVWRLLNDFVKDLIVFQHFL